MATGEDVHPKRKLKIDLSELETAFEHASWENGYFLDLATGAIVCVTEEAGNFLEEISASFEGEPEDFATYLEQALADSDLPDWMQEDVRTADQVEIGFPGRFTRIPQADSRAGYRDMEDFIATVRNDRLRNDLDLAIQGKGAFGRFKSVLANNSRERERWFEFSAAQERKRVLEWLAAEGIELLD